MDGRLARPRPGRSPYVTIHKIFWQSGQWHAMACPMLKVPRQHPKRGRLGLTDGSCSRRRPEYRHHVWAYDWVAERTHDGRPLKILTVVAAYSRACLALVVARRLRTTDVFETLADLFIRYGVPAHARSDNGPAFTTALVRLWLERLDVQRLFIEPGGDRKD